MSLELLVGTLALVLSMAGQTSSYTPQSWTTKVVYVVVGTQTITSTVIVPCPTTTSYITSTTVVTTTECDQCQPCVSITTVCVPDTNCEAVYPCDTSVTWCNPESTCIDITTCETTTVPCITTDPPVTDPPATDPPSQQQPYTTITSGTIVYVVMPSAGAAGGPVTTGGILDIISTAGGFKGYSYSVMINSLALALMMLVLLLM